MSSFGISNYRTLSGGTVQIVTPLPLPGEIANLIIDDFKIIADSINTLATNASGYAQTAQNLHDLTSVVIARLNLGLGTAATTNASAYDAAGAASTAQSNAETYAANASNLSSGTVGTGRLGSGSASSSTFLRGDQTWATLSSGEEVVAVTNGNGLVLTAGTLAFDGAEYAQANNTNLTGSLSADSGAITTDGSGNLIVVSITSDGGSFYSDGSGNIHIASLISDRGGVTTNGSGTLTAINLAGNGSAVKSVTGGYVKYAYNDVTAAYSVSSSLTFCVFLCANSSGTAYAVTLPSASTVGDRTYIFKKTDANSNTINITPTSSTIDGASVYALSAQYKYVSIYCDGTNWWICSNN